ncbi:protein GRINL1A [Hemiscyllium ocellatum]|uniref:protein GRINL1A n=1 Tax=Hemiscyllium ocellatum TaxID=170820 RepID=UPI0029668992|nr:protein GRINL1A [Hemiscyllium ocellatum]
MSAALTERQGVVGDLQQKPKAELLELLRRQRKLQANRKFIQNLPDKGKRIAEFIEKLEAAISQHEEVERATEMLSAFKLEFQNQQKVITSDKEEILHLKSTLPTRTPGQEVGNKLKDCNEAEKSGYVLSQDDGEATINRDKLNQERPAVFEKEHAPSGCYTAKGKGTTRNENSLDNTESNQGTKYVEQERSSHSHFHDIANDLEADLVNRADLLSDRLDKVSLTDNGKVSCKIDDPPLNNNVKLKANPFQTLHQENKRPHYIDILEHRAKNPVMKRSQFKTNRPILESPSSSPDQSPGRSELKLSPAERRLRDRKHLDDITAARLPPLYHSPAQLLSVEESRELQISQKQKYESTQAKLAAAKLTQRLNIKMMNFDPEGTTATAFREYRDHGGSSSEEDLS